MATVKTRINISLSDRSTNAIAKLASRDQVPPATMAARLIETALELEEDHGWEKLAQQRDTPDAQYVSHKTAWK